MPRPVRRLFAAIASAVALGVLAAAAGLALPGVAQAAVPGPDVPVAVAPEEGEFLESGSVVLEWTAVDALGGYEVTWSADDTSAATATTTSTTLTIGVERGSVAWQVRALPEGAWSSPATFHVDPELPTLPLPDQPSTPTDARPGTATVPDGVWVIGALGFSVVFLAVVVIQSRLRREQDA